jgi:hypothetical protein
MPEGDVAAKRQRTRQRQPSTRRAFLFAGWSPTKGPGGFVPDCRARRTAESAKQEIDVAQTTSLVRSQFAEHRCTLNRTEVFEQTLAVRRLAAIPGCWELRIVSRLESAKDPRSEQLQFGAVVTHEQIAGLHAMLTAVLEGGKV